MLIAPIPTAGPTPGNLWFAPLRSAKHAASNVSAEPGLAPVHSASTDSSTRSAPTAATRLTTAQGLVKWPSRRVRPWPIGCGSEAKGAELADDRNGEGGPRPGVHLG